jgi:hypothetical protein
MLTADDEADETSAGREGERRASVFDERSRRAESSAGNDTDACNRDGVRRAALSADATTGSSDCRLDDDTLSDNPSAAAAAVKGVELRAARRRGVDAVRAEPLRDDADATREPSSLSSSSSSSSSPSSPSSRSDLAAAAGCLTRSGYSCLRENNFSSRVFVTEAARAGAPADGVLRCDCSFITSAPIACGGSLRNRAAYSGRVGGGGSLAAVVAASAPVVWCASGGGGWNEMYCWRLTCGRCCGTCKASAVAKSGDEARAGQSAERGVQGADENCADKEAGETGDPFEGRAAVVAAVCGDTEEASVELQ